MQTSSQNSIKTALITGASSGIGKAFAKLLAQQGYQLFLIGLNAEYMQETKTCLEKYTTAAIHCCLIDLSQADSVTKIVTEFKSLGWKLDLLINNAGIGVKGDFANLSWTEIHQMLMINIHASIELTYQLLPELLKQHSGQILFTASTAAFLPGPGMAIYFATKAFLTSFGRALAMELENTNIEVKVLCPGPTKTRFAKSAYMENNKIHQGIVPILEAEEVAQWGLKALTKKNSLVIVGWINKLCAYLAYYLPQKWSMRAVYKLHKD